MIRVIFPSFACAELMSVTFYVQRHDFRFSDDASLLILSVIRVARSPCF